MRPDETLTEYAKRLGVSRKTLFRWRVRGFVPAPTAANAAPTISPDAAEMAVVLSTAKSDLMAARLELEGTLGHVRKLREQLADLETLKLDKQKEARAIEEEIQGTKAELRSLRGESAKMREEIRALTDLRNTLREQTESGIAEQCKAWLDRSREGFWQMLKEIGVGEPPVPEGETPAKVADARAVLRDQVDARTYEEGRRAWEDLRLWAPMYKLLLEGKDPMPEAKRMRGLGWTYLEVDAVARVLRKFQTAGVPWWIVEARTEKPVDEGGRRVQAGGPAV